MHMSEDAQGAEFAKHNRLEKASFINDPGCELSRAFGLARGSLRQILGPKVWIRGLQSALIERRGFGKPVGDIRQMSGVFLVHHGEVLRSFIHKTIADKPDYLALAKAEASS